MAILYNMEPLAAMDIFYDGEKNGVWDGDLVKNSKENGFAVPPVLREFLEKYAYLDMNKGQITFFHPDDIRVLHLPVDGGAVHIMVIGRVDETLIGIDLGTKNMEIAVGNIEDGSIMWEPSDGMTLSGMMRLMFISTLFKSSDKYLFQGAEINAVLKKHGVERSMIAPSGGNAQHISINFDEENGAFLVAEFDKSGKELALLHVAPRKTYEQRKAERFATVSLDELNSLFKAEFYMNASHCDFEHALELKLEIIRRMEQNGAASTEQADHYKLAGRCLWALGRLDEALERYKKAGSIIRESGDVGRLADYYHTMGCFYADTKQWEKSEEMFDAELAVRSERFPEKVYDIGMIFRTKAEFLDSADGDPDRVIELCELALEQFGKNPHDSGCKYETARAQQLRGNARRRKKNFQNDTGDR